MGKIIQSKLPKLAKMMHSGVKPEVARQRLKIPKAQFDAYIKACVMKARDRLLATKMRDKSVIVHPNWRPKLLSVMKIRAGTVGGLKYVKFDGKTVFQHTALHMAGYSVYTVTGGAVAIGVRAGASIYIAPQTTKSLDAAKMQAARLKAKKIFARQKGKYAYGLPKLVSDKMIKANERKILADAGYARLRIFKNNRGLPVGTYWITPRGAKSLGIKDTKQLHNFAFAKRSVR